MYSFHCTIWWLALLRPPPLLSHFLSLFTFSCVTLSGTVRPAGDSADVRMTLMFLSGGCLALLCRRHSSNCLCQTMKDKKKNNECCWWITFYKQWEETMFRSRGKLVGENLTGICYQKLQRNSFVCIIIRQYNKLSNLRSIISAYSAITGATEKWMDLQTAPEEGLWHNNVDQCTHLSVRLQGSGPASTALFLNSLYGAPGLQNYGGTFLTILQEEEVHSQNFFFFRVIRFNKALQQN